MRVKQIKNSDLFLDVEEVIRDGGSVTIRVKGYSMRPFLRNERDSVVLASIDGVTLRRGMVVLFRYKGAHILHRIRKIKGDRLTIKGDGNYRIVEYAEVGDVVAYVKSINRRDRDIDYRSLRWYILSAQSLVLKNMRAVRNKLLV